jgi:pimeloyl-ACP methyl ester carboxylesterase
MGDIIDALVANGLIPMRDGAAAYHLYGQSFGGILAFEALTTKTNLPAPRSLTLANVPSSMPILLEEVASLLADLDGDASRFDTIHGCRTTPRPPALLAPDAPGHPGSHWRGVDVIADWCALESGVDSLQLPVLLLAAEHDFVSLRSIEGWQRLAQQRLVVIPGAAHHALLDQPEAYGAVLEGFLQEHDAIDGCAG